MKTSFDRSFTRREIRLIEEIIKVSIKKDQIQGEKKLRQVLNR